MSTIDLTLVAAAIASCPETSPSAREEASELVEAWIVEFGEHDTQERILAVEHKFNVQLDSRTWVIGIIDLLTIMANGEVQANEWKTTAPASRWWTEAKWIERLLTSIQLPTYLLPKVRVSKTRAAIETLAPSSPQQVRVRAAVKTSPPAFWPTLNAGLWEFSKAELAATIDAYSNAAIAIRTLRTPVRRIPWQATGAWCFNQFGHDCELLGECRAQHYPPALYKVVDEDSTHLATFGLNPARLPADAVILSPTSYDLWGTCPEKYRQLKAVEGAVKLERTHEMEVGAAFHAGLACYYNEVKTTQEGGARKG